MKISGQTRQKTGRIISPTLQRTEPHLWALSTWKSVGSLIARSGRDPCVSTSQEKTHKTFTAARWLTFTVNEAESVSGIGKVWPDITPPHESEMDMELLLAAFAPNCADPRYNKSYGEKSKIYNLKNVSDLPREACWKVFFPHIPQQENNGKKNPQ